MLNYRVFLAPFILACSVSLADTQPAVVVVANRQVPDSVDLAEYYIQQRGLSTNHLCVLDLPETEAMSRRDYETKLRDPLLEFLRRKELIQQTARDPAEVQEHESSWTTTESSVKYIVSMYGVPVRITDTRGRIARAMAEGRDRTVRRDGAAVDSELALLLAAPYDIMGPQRNPMFGSLPPSRDMPDEYFVVLAARLDGPDPQTVRRMMDEALFAEQHGLLGRVYLDARGLRDGPYVLGDYWIREAGERFRREGYEVFMDADEAIWDVDFPMEHAAVYLGWYAEHVSGPFTRESLRFQPGAIAYHLHSASAAELRTVAELVLG